MSERITVVTVIYMAVIIDVVGVSLRQEEVRKVSAGTRKKEPLGMTMSPPSIFKLLLFYF